MANTLKKTLDPAPFYALVGVADYAVENVRETLDSAAGAAAAFRSELAPKNVQTRIVSTVNGVREQVEALPSVATQRYESVAGGFERTYDELAKGWDGLVERGENVTRELRNQPAAKKLTEQVDDVTDRGRAAVAQARKTVSDTQDTAVSAVFAARKEAAKGVAELAGRVGDEAAELEAEAKTAQRSNAAKEGAAKPTAKRPTRRAVTKKATAKKTTAKKAPAKKSAAKKTTAKKA
ncbi:hypothetical protein [Flexivirga meconopsidis]|uniref:hypothetical protein n=1 Tax=Flexivirga meconopsidis TaxID=2977121 RepID=UPI00223FFF55|nr:hypothetical protein [Flexivirga meconopsidis]